MERSVTSTFLFLQDINRSLELAVRFHNTRVSEDHTTANFVFVDTTEEQTYVITSLTLVEEFTEHLNAGNDRLLAFCTETDQLNLITYFYDTRLNTTGSNSTTTGDREHVLNRHQERFVDSTRRKLNPVVNSIHELHYLVFPLRHTVQCTESRATDDRSIVAIELIEREEFTHFHLNEVEHLCVVHHIALVHEYYQARNVHLTSKQDVLTGLGHRTVGSSNYDDSSIHLSCTGYHVLDIVSVARAVYVCVVAVSSFVLNVCSVDSDTTLFLLGSVVDLVERLNLLTTEAFLVENQRDSSGKSSFSVVNVTDGTDVNVRFRAVKFLFCHSNTIILLTLIICCCLIYVFFDTKIYPSSRCGIGGQRPVFELMAGVEPATSSLPRMRSTTELH